MCIYPIRRLSMGEAMELRKRQIERLTETMIRAEGLGKLPPDDSILYA